MFFEKITAAPLFLNKLQVNVSPLIRITLLLECRTVRINLLMPGGTKKVTHT